MITSTELAYIQEHAYVPEHLPAYVTAVSPGEPFLINDCLAYVYKDRLTWIGYPLSGALDPGRISEAFDHAREQFQPSSISIAAPLLPVSLEHRPRLAEDAYYRLNLADFANHGPGNLLVDKKLRSLLRRASREIKIFKVDRIRKEHKNLIRDFIRSHRIPKSEQQIFNRIPQYIESASDTAWIIEARSARGDLVGFDVAEFGSDHCAFYMFNFCSRRHYVPGASDILLSEIIKVACSQGKRWLNMGLGINAGVTFFKTKWGAVPDLPYISSFQETIRSDWLDSFYDKL